MAISASAWSAPAAWGACICARCPAATCAGGRRGRSLGAARAALHDAGVTVHADLDAMLRAGWPGRRARRGAERRCICPDRPDCRGRHADPVREALRPHAGHAHEAAAIAAATGEAAGRLLATVRPGLKRLQSAHRDGELGELYFVACYQWDEQPPPAQFRAGSGGIFIDMGVHEFDQIRWLTGQEIARLHAARRHPSTAAGDAESAQVLCALSGGSTAWSRSAAVSPRRCLPGRGLRHPRRRGMPLPVAARWRTIFLEALRRQAEASALGRRRRRPRGERRRCGRRARSGREGRGANMTVRLGINPITWTNDDMPELGGDIPLEICLAETRRPATAAPNSAASFPARRPRWVRS